MKREPYRQTLPALALSLERYTDAVPADGWWYLRRDGELFARYRSFKEAQAAWERLLAESDWHPPERALDPSQALAREQAERWARNRGG